MFKRLARLVSVLLFPTLVFAQAPQVSVTTRAGNGAPLTFAQGDNNFLGLQYAANAANLAWGYKQTASSGLTFAYYGGVAWNGTAWVFVADGSVVLTANSTNYVERTQAGIVSFNTSGWTAGTKFPLAQVTTSGSAVTTIWDMRGSTDLVPSVFGRTGAVVATTGDYSVGMVTGAAPLASPTFTGTVTMAGALNGFSGQFNGLNFVYDTTNDRLGIGILNSIPLNANGAYIGWANSGIAGTAAGDLVLFPRSSIAGTTRLYAGSPSVEVLDITGTGAAVKSTTASTSTITGALTVAGGVGIGGNLNVGGTTTFTGPFNGALGQSSIGSGSGTTQSIFSVNCPTGANQAPIYRMFRSGIAESDIYLSAVGKLRFSANGGLGSFTDATLDALAGMTLDQSGGLTAVSFTGAGTGLTGIPESGVTNLVTDLAAKAPLASPTFTGTVNAANLNYSGQLVYIGASTTGLITTELTTGASDGNFRVVAINGTGSTPTTEQGRFGLQYLGTGMASGFSFYRGNAAVDGSIHFITNNIDQGNLDFNGNWNLGGSVTATSFSGAGTGLTGTAASLTAGSATTATTATAANGLASATTTVNVSAATAPTAGQILTATSGTAATWQTLAGTATLKQTVLTAGSGNWTAPITGIVSVRMIGAGGAGGSGSTVTAGGGGGSGQNGSEMVYNMAVVSGTNYAYNIPAGLTGAAAGVASPATAAACTFNGYSISSGVSGVSALSGTAGGIGGTSSATATSSTLGTATVAPAAGVQTMTPTTLGWVRAGTAGATGGVGGTTGTDGGIGASYDFFSGGVQGTGNGLSVGGGASAPGGPLGVGANGGAGAGVAGSNAGATNYGAAGGGGGRNGAGGSSNGGAVIINFVN